MENIQLTIAIDFISSKDAEEEHATHLKSDNIEFIISGNVNDIVQELFKTLLSRYQDNLKISIRGRVLFLIQLNCFITNVTE